VAEASDPESKVRAALERARLVERVAAVKPRCADWKRCGTASATSSNAVLPERTRSAWWSAIADVEAALGDVAAAREALEAARLSARGLRLGKIERALAALPQAPR
jgi:hypothetical protein